MEKKIFIGLDPGSASGAWGAIDQDGLYVGCGDLPTTDGRINAIELMELIWNDLPTHIAVEDVHTMPGQGIASSGKFMRAAGAIEAVGALVGADAVGAVAAISCPVLSSARACCA